MDRVDKYKRIEDDQQQGKGKAKVIPQERRDLGQTNIATTGQEGIMQINQGQTTLRLSVQSSESLCIKYWKKSRMNPSSNDPIRWWEIPKSETVTSIANIIRIMGIPQRIVGVYGIIWINLSEKANWNSCRIILVVWGAKPTLGLRETSLQDLPWKPSMLSSLH